MDTVIKRCLKFYENLEEMEKSRQTQKTQEEPQIKSFRKN